MGVWNRSKKASIAAVLAFQIILTLRQRVWLWYREAIRPDIPQMQTKLQSAGCGLIMDLCRGSGGSGRIATEGI